MLKHKYPSSIQSKLPKILLFIINWFMFWMLFGEASGFTSRLSWSLATDRRRVIALDDFKEES